MDLSHIKVEFKNTSILVDGNQFQSEKFQNYRLLRNYSIDNPLFKINSKKVRSTETSNNYSYQVGDLFIDFDKTTYETNNLEDINVSDTILIEDVSFGYPDNYIELIVENVSTSKQYIALMRQFQEILKITSNNISSSGDLTGAINIYKKYNIYTQNELKSGKLDLSFQNLDLSGNLILNNQLTFSDTSGSSKIIGGNEIIIDPSPLGSSGGKVFIKGDLIIDGSNTIINSTTLDISDNIIQMNAYKNINNKGGIQVNDVCSNSVGYFLYDVTNNTWDTSGADLTIKSLTINGLIYNESINNFINGTTYQVAANTASIADICTNIIPDICSNITDISNNYYTQTQLKSGSLDLSFNNLDIAGDLIIKGDSSESGKITLNCEKNTHGIKIQGPLHNATASYTLTLPNDTGKSGQVLQTDGNGKLSFVDAGGGGSGTGGVWSTYTDNSDNIYYSKGNGKGKVAIGSSTSLTDISAALHITGDLVVTQDITAFYSSSDERLKTNIQQIENPINIVEQLNGVSFNWNETAKNINGAIDLNKKEIGLIAQEVEKVVPEVIKPGLENYMAINYDKLTPLLIEAVKSQQKQIDELNLKIDKILKSN